jgi:2-keto-4-pentenoate hydratase/2-oxohepta-3-ene-1,7-dioic acid hydratase in catechol pathway
MHYARFQVNSNQQPLHGWLEGEGITVLVDAPFINPQRTNQRYSLQQVTLLAPTVPSKVIAISGNYWPSAETSDVPQFYFKPPSAVVGTGAAIEIPPQAKQLSFEAELAVVMGRRARWITVIDAPRYILGYTCALDVTATDLLHRDGNVTRAKAFDTFLPLGPTICPIVDPADLVLICAVNGGVRQMASTRDLCFAVPQLVAYLSSILTLEPGDVILTGSPVGGGLLNEGDTVEVEIEGVGRLQNWVKRV